MPGRPAAIEISPHERPELRNPTEVDGGDSLSDAHRPRVPFTFERIIVAVAMAVLALITMANVVVRYLTNYSFAFTEEYSIALLVVVALLGTSIATAENRHIRIAWFVERLPAKRLEAVETLVSIATIVMFLLLAWLGTETVLDEYRNNVTSPGLGYPQWIYTLALPVFSAAIAARALGYLLRMRRRARTTRSASVERA
jgi:TRAP-type C4-dicarboxylate transport system permease small subunit